MRLPREGLQQSVLVSHAVAICSPAATCSTTFGPPASVVTIRSPAFPGFATVSKTGSMSPVVSPPSKRRNLVGPKLLKAPAAPAVASEVAVAAKDLELAVAAMDLELAAMALRLAAQHLPMQCSDQ